MEFGYWGIKGRGELIRWLIAYLKLDVKEVAYTDPAVWFGDKKKSLNLPFPNLPYLVDGNVKLSESAAIPVYLSGKANRSDLFGKDFTEQAQVRMILGVLEDISKNAFMPIYASPNEEATKAGYAKALEEGSAAVTKINEIAAFLGDKEYLLGHLTFADLSLAYVSEVFAATTLALGVPCPVCKHENISKLVERVHSLEGIKDLVEARKEIPYLPPHMIKFHCFTAAELAKKRAIECKCPGNSCQCTNCPLGQKCNCAK